MRPYLIAFCLFPIPAFADDIILSSKVTDVTVYPQGASITRQVPYSAPAGRHVLILPDLPRNVDFESLRIQVEGAVLGEITMREDYVPPRIAGPSPEIEAAEAVIEGLEDDIAQTRDQAALVRLEKAAANARIAFLNQIGEADGLAGQDVSNLQAIAAMIGTETLAARQSAHSAEREARRIEEALKELMQDLDDAQAALKALTPETEERAYLSASINAGGGAEGMLSVTYTTWDAGWTPVYDARLDRAAEALAIDRGAYVFQETGENWEDVSVVFSTVRPSSQINPSQVTPWRRWIDDPAPKMAVRTFDSEMSAMAEPMLEAPVIVEEAAGTSFDGLVATYAVPGTLDVASGADLLRVALDRLETSAQSTAVAVPLYDETAFLQAEFTNDFDDLILPSDYGSFYMDGRYVGQNRVGLIPAGAEATLSFGAIDGLRLTRTVLDRNTGDRGVLTRSNERTENVRIDVENLTGESWALRVLDRVPYSEQEDLEISWDATPRPSKTDFDGKRGVLAWNFDLSAGQTQSITLGHRLTWPEDKELR